jgi:hypothetical protein
MELVYLALKHCWRKPSGWLNLCHILLHIRSPQRLQHLHLTRLLSGVE